MKIEVKTQRTGKKSYLSSAIQGKVEGHGKIAKEAREQCQRKLALYLHRLASFVPCMRKAKDGTIFVFEVNGEGFGYVMVRDPEKYASSSAYFYDADSVEKAREIMLRHFEQYNQACVVDYKTLSIGNKREDSPCTM